MKLQVRDTAYLHLSFHNCLENSCLKSFYALLKTTKQFYLKNSDIFLSMIFKIRNPQLEVRCLPLEQVGDKLQILLFKNAYSPDVCSWNRTIF